MIAIAEHPAYAPFFKLLKVGVPVPVVQAKIGNLTSFLPSTCVPLCVCVSVCLLHSISGWLAIREAELRRGALPSWSLVTRAGESGWHVGQLDQVKKISQTLQKKEFGQLCELGQLFFEIVLGV